MADIPEQRPTQLLHLVFGGELKSMHLYRLLDPESLTQH